jgi:transcriptional regulator, XRE family
MVFFMATIGERIAELRKQKSMTQEEFAAIVGVSAKSVSKWENNTNMPDIMLLPIIADTFGVTVDMLYGRRSSPCSATSSDAVFDAAYRSVCQVILSACGGAVNFNEPFLEIEKLDNYVERMKSNKKLRSTVIHPHGVVYLRDEIGEIALKRPEKGWSSLLTDAGAEEILNMLIDRDFRNALQTVIKNNMTSFTLSSLCTMCGISDSDALEAKLIKGKLFLLKQVNIDGENVTVYELAGAQRVLLLFAILTYAKEYSNYKDCYWICCGDSRFCSGD